MKDFWDHFVENWHEPFVFAAILPFLAESPAHELFNATVANMIIFVLG